MAKSGLSQLIPYVVNFSAVVGILGYVGRKPLQKFLYQRHEHLKDLMESAARAYHSAKERFEKTSGKLSHFDREAKEILQRAEHAGVEQAEEIMKNATADVERVAKDAERILANEINEHQKTIRNRVINEAIEKTKEILKKDLKSEDHSRILKSVRSSLEAEV